ncbi:hypothetical protein Glove_248g30 [Diversispora epigaea]|uniref:Protein kinase domain-containing protein n=1 Tax=Diversispora epigaea TaxID=1348612 RepID=A0A397IAP2_9GLOM|nr:hypothetical protein Glove_248g30 [Diversispora epigaea]
MSQEKIIDHESIGDWKTWIDNLIIEETIQKNDIPFYQYSEFSNVELISKNVYKATFKISQKTVALKCIFLNDNDNFTQDKSKGIKNWKIMKAFLGYMVSLNKRKLNSENILVHNGKIKLNYFGISRDISKFLRFLTTTFGIKNWKIMKAFLGYMVSLNKRKLNSENILVHNGKIKLNYFGISRDISKFLRFLTTTFGPIQYMDPQYLELFNTIGKNMSSDIFSLGIILWEISSGDSPFGIRSLFNVDLLNNIIKGKREMVIPGTPPKYQEIYTDCWKHNENLRPNISQVIKNLSEIIISDASVEIESSLSHFDNVTDKTNAYKLEIQNKESEVRSDSHLVDVKAEVNVFIQDLFKFFTDLFKKQSSKSNIQPIMIKNYIIKERNMNPAEVLYEMIIHKSHHWFTSLIGFFYWYGIGTIVDDKMAFKFFSLAANEIIDKKNFSFNQEIGCFYLVTMYLNGRGVKKDMKKAFQICSKISDEGSLVALNQVAFCYKKGLGVEKNEKKAFEIYLRSAEKGNLEAQINIGYCYLNGIGTILNESEGFRWSKKSALAGNIDAIYNVGCCYNYGKGVGINKKKAFECYLAAAEKGNPLAQYNVGYCRANGYGIDKNQTIAFEWYKKAAENDDIDGQCMIGKCFYEGYGIKRDIVKAIYWLNKAKEKGNTDANRY